MGTKTTDLYRARTQDSGVSPCFTWFMGLACFKNASRWHLDVANRDSTFTCHWPAAQLKSQWTDCNFCLPWLQWHSCFGVTNALMKCNAAVSPLGGTLSGRRAPHNHCLSWLHCSLLSLICGLRLLVSVVFPEPHLSRHLPRQSPWPFPRDYRKIVRL